MSAKTKPIKCTTWVPPEQSPLDFVRVQQAGKTMGISYDMLNDWNRQGLKFYHMGRPAFVSCSEVNEFIRSRATIHAGKQEKGVV